ncbi:uncharacterized protein LOC103500495 isoform X1 [Cucumis melo]|uniref:Uncharacterized protein LOC103500495 isoform X1 n=1 Tax=Cucumis melo TaxID=3656 RepID=A0ABM3KDG5_CUCME|nr:uncharacterized protein LOC103500495 isoform X1 [Cucumis melo]XP_050935819.1 uncharacterized protein LOC103500495 isoform X1 [Cucumis melo]
MEGVENITTEKQNNSMGPKRRLSCTTCFDALWFCYSPVHQMQQYYRVGVFDNCSSKWTALLDCLNLKTKRASEVQKMYLECRKFLKAEKKQNLTSGLFEPQKKHHHIGRNYLDI